MEAKREETEENKVNPEVLNDQVTAQQDDTSHELEHHEEEEEHQEDYSDFSKEQLLQAINTLAEKGNVLKIDKQLNELKTLFDEHVDKEKATALEKFIQDGGLEEDFAFKLDDISHSFYAQFTLLKDKRHQLIKEQEKQKEKNLEAKTALLEKLRELLDSDETNASIAAIKEIQSQWKAIGQVPYQQNKTLWANYNALMDRFYDHRSIYFELKELDRKKNLEAKLELCEKAEKLDSQENIKEAIISLNELHEEFKHLGPVPKEDQESLWLRFKTASDKIYAKRKDYLDSQKEVFKENLEKKEALITKLEAFTSFKSDKIKLWNTKTKEILALQKEWESIGMIAREAAKDINKRFWSAFKEFFNNKNAFFKTLDEQRQENLKLKEALVEKAEALKDSKEWDKTAKALKNLQNEWRAIGPVPEKVRDAIYNRFKAACDFFFDQKRSGTKEQNQEYITNLNAKEALCQEILNASKEDKVKSEDKVQDFINRWNEIGFVPRNNIKSITKAFNEALDQYIAGLDLPKEEKDNLVFRISLNKIKNETSSTKILNKKEIGMRKQISELENNIVLWKNNLEFFSQSKTADKLKAEFDQKIEKANEEIEKLKEKLKIIQQF